MLIACLDIYYHDDHTVAAAVTFDGWGAERARVERVERLPQAAPYVPGEFYKRELPPLMHMLGLLDPPDIVLIDGFVWLGPDHPGLGARLHDALGQRCPVVGVAKNPFAGSPGVSVSRRGTKALWVTAAGMDPAQAALHVDQMHGDFRIPTLLKRVDLLSRSDCPR